MFKHPLPLLVALLLIVSPLLAADVEYSTTGVMDMPATHGGDRDFWGTDFVTQWTNNTGQDVLLEEFGWPCAGWWSQFWYVWITDTIPNDPYTLEYYGSFVSAIVDETQYPPSAYTYVDVSEEGIVIPPGATMFFGYGNPGMGGQIYFNGVETFSWYEDNWDMDGEFFRTAVMQFKGSFTAPSATGELPDLVTLRGNHPNPFNPTTTIEYALPAAGNVQLAVYDTAGRLVRVLEDGGWQEAGWHQTVWDGRDASGRTAGSGVYLTRLSAGGKTTVRPMVMLK